MSGNQVDRERLRGFLAFWLLAAVAFAGLGVWTLTSDHGAGRLGDALLLLGAGCAAIAFLLGGAARRS